MKHKRTDASLIPLGRQSGASLQRSIHQGKREPGIIIFPDGETGEWNWYGLSEQHGTLYAKGDELTIIPYLETMDPESVGEDSKLQEGSLLFKAFSLVAQREGCLGGDIFHGLFRISPTGGILVLPKVLREIIKAGSDLDDQLLPTAGLSEKSSKLLSEEELAAFYTAASLYRMLTGANPFPPQEYTSPWERFDLAGPVHPGLLRNDLDKATADILDMILSLPRTISIQISAGKRDAARETRRGFGKLQDLLQRPGSAEPSLIDQSALQREEIRRSRSLRRRIFLRRHRKRITTVLLVSTILALLISFLGNLFFRELPTDGLPPEEVAYLYYDGRNRLDHETVDAALGRSAASGLVNELTSLYVIYRVRQGYEGKDMFLPADTWFAQGAPEVEDGTLVYGAAGIAIKPLEMGDEQSSFLGSAILVFPDNEGDRTDMDILYLQEELKLEKGRRRWEIISIRRIQERPLEREEALHILKKLSEGEEKAQQ